MKTEHDFFHKYLSENISDVDTLERMRNVIAEFSSRALKIIVMKCIDGRNHGSTAKGYPPTTYCLHASFSAGQRVRIP